MKTCNKCNLTKSLLEFFKDKNNKTDGHYSICKECKTTGSMKWRAQHREKYNENQRKQHAKHYLRNRLYRYKLSPDEYNKMLLNQSNLCAICQSPPKGTRPLAIDHDHKTGQVRGLLCFGCNRALHVLESEDLLARSMAYLAFFKKAA